MGALGWLLNLGFAGGGIAVETEQKYWGPLSWEEWEELSWSQWETLEWEQTVPDQPGLEFTIPENRMHHTMPVNRMHFTMPENRIQFTISEED